MSTVTTNIYRDDHILGLSEDELNADLYYSWGEALGKMLPSGAKFLVSSDIRKSSKQYKSSLIRGLTSQGIHVFDAGTIPTDLGTYGYSRIEASGCASVTGGSAPPAWNGLRWFLDRSPFILREQLDRLQENSHYPCRPGGVREGTVRPIDIPYDWISWMQNVWFDTPPTAFRIVIDPMFGNWSVLARQTLQAAFPRMVFEAVHDIPDCDLNEFHNGLRDPKSIAKLSDEVDLKRADFGIALDVDAGAFQVIDRDGVPLLPEEFIWLVLHDMLGNALEGEIFLHDELCPKILVDEAIRFGGLPMLVPRVNSEFVTKMKQTGALLGFGAEGELYFRGARGHRIVLFAICWLLDFFARSDIGLSEWRKNFPIFFSTPEFETSWASPNTVIDRLEHCLATAPGSTLDGIRFTCSDARVHLRELANEGKLGFHFEADNRIALHRVVTDCCSALEDLNGIGPSLIAQFRAETMRRFFVGV